jgi:hypothetical protein
MNERLLAQPCVAIGPEGAWYAGHEDGPLTHSGDGDRSQIRSTGVVDVAAVAQCLKK